jgi:hypothetical protein
MKKSILLFSAACLLFSKASAQDIIFEPETPAQPQETGAPIQPQDAPPVKLLLPKTANWNVVKEGQKLEFQLNATGGSSPHFSYFIQQGLVEGMAFDTLGNFSWTPGYEFVDRLSASRTVQVLFEVRNDLQESTTQLAEFRVLHVNRPPIVGDLKPLYIQYNSLNTYTIESAMVKDEDNDPIVFIPIPDAMLQGMKLSETGVFTWKPSSSQFRKLETTPIYLEFFVEDQPSKARTKGRFRIEVTQEDMAPNIQMIPSQRAFRFKEDGTLNIKFQLSDPNGENDIAYFSFITQNTNVPPAALVKNSASQYEFIWKPGYDFVKDPLDSLQFELTFYVLDKSQKRDERRVSFTVMNAVNEPLLDQKLYNEYRASLVRAWDLLEQLKEAEKDLKKKYNRAKKGRKGRSITNATVGAGTGLAPVIVDIPATSRKITTIGGTTTMTIGTLEATEVIGRSTKDLVERLNYIMEKKNELQTRGDTFARKYALKSSRRRPEFMQDVDQFVALMNLRGLVALELDAGWQNKLSSTDEQIAKTFRDFGSEK